MNSHTKGGWYHCEHCDYKNKDKRNTDSHMRIHSTDEETNLTSVTSVANKCSSARNSGIIKNKVARSKVSYYMWEQWNVRLFV